MFPFSLIFLRSIHLIAWNILDVHLNAQLQFAKVKINSRQSIYIMFTFHKMKFEFSLNASRQLCIFPNPIRQWKKHTLKTHSDLHSLQTCSWWRLEYKIVAKQPLKWVTIYQILNCYRKYFQHCLIRWTTQIQPSEWYRELQKHCYEADLHHI